MMVCLVDNLDYFFIPAIRAFQSLPTRYAADR